MFCIRVRALIQHRATGRVAAAAAHMLIVVLILSVPAVAFADPGMGVDLLAAPDPGGSGGKTLHEVVASLQAWIMGILAAIATLYLVLGGVYRATAGGDPAQVDKANAAFKNALIGYGLAVLAPVLLEVVKGIVGG